jgi:hypothetical protein
MNNAKDALFTVGYSVRLIELVSEATFASSIVLSKKGDHEIRKRVFRPFVYRHLRRISHSSPPSHAFHLKCKQVFCFIERYNKRHIKNYKD